MEGTREIHVLGVPLDHGAGRRGVGMGPSAIRIAGLHDAMLKLGHRIVDLGDLTIPAPETKPQGEVNAKYLSLIAKCCESLCEQVRGVLAAGGFPLVLGGDHSIAMGTVSGIAQHLRAEQGGEAPPKLGIIWLDAHGDINTPETSPSGNVHGMPVSCLLGNGPPALTSLGFEGRKCNPQTFVQVGLREIDLVEKKLLRDSGIHTYTMADVDRRGMYKVMEEAIEFALADTEHLHLSFDIDAVDPRLAPGTGTPKLGGLSFRETHLAMEMIADTQRLASLEIAELNPTLDEKNQTAELAVGFLASALGKRIL